MRDVCDRCGISQGAITVVHEWAWIDDTPCIQRQKCERCGIIGGVNEKGHVWEWGYAEPNTFTRREVCKNCGVVGRSDYTAWQIWTSICNDEDKKRSYLNLQNAIRDLDLSQMKWKINSSVLDWDEKANLHLVFSRSPFKILNSNLDFTNIPLNCIKVGSWHLVFYPDKVSVIDNFLGEDATEKYSCDYNDLRVKLTVIEFKESSRIIPHDAEVVSYTWLYARIDGGPDRRRANNRHIPILRYGQIKLYSGATDWTFHVSNLAYARALTAALSEYIQPKQKHSQEGSSKTSGNSSVLDGRTPYEILGVNSGASIQEITKAYRKLARENHPDRVYGLAEEFTELAEHRMKLINAAYEELKQKLKS